MHGTSVPLKMNMLHLEKRNVYVTLLLFVCLDEQCQHAWLVVVLVFF